MIPTIEVAIFSYNRVIYLKNAIKSVQRSLPSARIRVFDDNSTEPEMLEYLASLGQIVVQTGESGTSRHGGLYANMQRAYDTAEGEYLLMLQDDTQLVRAVDAQDWRDIGAIFAADPNCAFVSVLFMRGSRMRRYRRQLAAIPERGVYDAPHNLSRKNFSRRLSYYDVCLWNVERLRKKGWTILPSEGQNVVRARELFSTMPVIKNPFVFFCPEVPFFRNRSQTLAARMATKYVGSNLKAYVPMTEVQVDELRGRPMERWPKAEDFLLATDPNVVKPFVFKDVKARWWLYALHKLEQKFWRKR